MTSSNSDSDGIRRGPLSPQNLFMTDPALAGLVGSFGGGNPTQMRGTDIAPIVLGPPPSHFPELVLTFLDRSRACMAYGGFYYPLFTIGLGQLGLAAEAALREYAAIKGIDRHDRNGNWLTWSALLDRLRSRGTLTEAQKTFWDLTRQWRNFLFHPEEEVTITLAIALLNLKTMTEELLILFPLPEGEVWPPEI